MLRQNLGAYMFLPLTPCTKASQRRFLYSFNPDVADAPFFPSRLAHLSKELA